MGTTTSSSGPRCTVQATRERPSCSWALPSDRLRRPTGPPGVASQVPGSAGDVNGDGYADVIVGARFYGPDDGGAAFLFLGSATGPSAAPDWAALGHQTSGELGTSVATAGDVNGDGYDDVMAGASAYDEGIQFDEGGALLFLGSATGPSGRPEWTADGLEEQTYFGTSVASAGDVNGDGYADVLAGAPGWAFEGAAFAWRGPL